MPRTPPRCRISLIVGGDGLGRRHVFSSFNTSSVDEPCQWGAECAGPVVDAAPTAARRTGPAARRPGRPRARTPSSPRWRSAALSRSDTRSHPETRTAAARRPGRRPTARRAGRRRGGMGSPCGSWVGWPSAASMRSSSRSDSTCSSSSASACTSCHGMPSIRLRNVSSSRWRRTTRSAASSPDSVSRSSRLPGAVDELAVLQSLDHGGDRGRRDAQLGRQQPGGDRLTAVGEVVDRLEVVLARAGQANHDSGM